MRRRPRVLVLVVVGIIAFVVISALLARALSADGAERAAVTSLVQAEVHGDATRAQAQVRGCSATPSCRARVAANIVALRRPGALAVLQLETSTGFSLSGTLGTARVAFRIGNSPPIVQCVRVHRAGNVLSGLEIE